MKKYIFVCGALVALGVGRAFGADKACMATSCGAGDYPAVNVINGCSMAPRATCYGDWAVLSCMLCASGYTRKSGTVTVPGCVGSFSYNYCQEDCNGCNNCTSDASWSPNGTGYEQKVTRTCDCNTCKATTSYRCAAGYYGSSLNGTTGCARCPENGNSNAGTTSVTGCYVTSGSDATGSCTYTQNCYYSN